MKRAPVTTLTLVESGKRPRRDDDDDSDSSEESLEAGSKATKQPEELKAITWKLCEPVPVKVDGDGRIAVNGNRVYVSPEYSQKLYEFNADKREWVSSIECDRRSFGIAVLSGDLTLVGGESNTVSFGESLHSALKTLTSFVRDTSGTKWIQKYPPMGKARVNVHCCSDERLLVVGSQFTNTMEVMDVTKKTWKDVKFLNDYGQIASMTILGDRLYVVSSNSEFTSYSTVSTCFTSALLESQPSGIEQPLVWHKIQPITDLYKPFLASLCGNLVAIGGNMTVKTYSGFKSRQCQQYFFFPKLYVYADKVNNRGWKFVADLPRTNGYPVMNFVVATLQGDRLIVCGGDYYTDEDEQLLTDIVHIGLFQ